MSFSLNSFFPLPDVYPPDVFIEGKKKITSLPVCFVQAKRALFCTPAIPSALHPLAPQQPFSAPHYLSLTWAALCHRPYTGAKAMINKFSRTKQQQLGPCVMPPLQSVAYVKNIYQVCILTTFFFYFPFRVFFFFFFLLYPCCSPPYCFAAPYAERVQGAEHPTGCPCRGCVCTDKQPPLECSQPRKQGGWRRPGQPQAGSVDT